VGLVDLVKAIRDLYEEKKRLDAVIASLEAMLAADTKVAVPTPLKRRGRKSMSRDERSVVSERMKRYWAARRQQRENATRIGPMSSATSA